VAPLDALGCDERFLAFSMVDRLCNISLLSIAVVRCCRLCDGTAVVGCCCLLLSAVGRIRPIGHGLIFIRQTDDRTLVRFTNRCLVAVMSHDTTDVSENIWCQITQKASKTDTYGIKLVPLTYRWLMAVMSYDTTNAKLKSLVSNHPKGIQNRYL
jgi:hypothetical protein